MKKKNPAPQKKGPKTKSLLAISLCWITGLTYAVFAQDNPNRARQNIPSLYNARAIEAAQQTFFEMPVDPSNQRRWIETLGLDLVRKSSPPRIPNFSILSEWKTVKPFQRPPFGISEVENWWNKQSRLVSKGYIRQFESGGFIVLDMETDTLTGWANTSEIRALFQ